MKPSRLRRLLNAVGSLIPAAPRARGGPGFHFDSLENRTMLAAVTWTGAAGDDLWHTPANWNTGVVPTAADDVTIPDVTGTPTIKLTSSSGNRTVNSLTSRERLQIAGGSLSITSTWSLETNADLSGGTVKGGTITQSGGAKLVLTSQGGTLDGVTFNGDLDATATSAYANITNGLTLNGTATLGNAAELRFQGTQTLGGNATVTLNGGADGLLTYQSGMTLTIGAGITVQGGGSSSSTTYIGSSSNNVSIVLLGTINANVAGQTIVVKPQGSGSLTNNGSINVTTGTLGLLPDTTGTLTNTGTISVSGGSITLGGAFTKAGLGTFNRTGGAVYLSGVLDNTSKTLAFDASSGSWNLYGGTVKGGTITQSGGAKLVLTSQGGTLDGVTFNGDLDATATSAYANITNGLTLNGTATLGNAAELRFQGTQTLGGNATVTLNGGADGLLTYQSGMTLTIGAGITVQGGGSSSSTTYIGSSSNNVSIVLLGTINANVAGQTIVVKPQGSGSLTNNGSINVTTGTLGLLPDTTGTLTNTGTISVSGGSITLGGAFTKAGLGTFNRTGGAVYLSGVLDNTSKTLAFDASSGSWNLYGGTVKGGTITQSGGAKLVLTSQGGTLDGVTFNGDLDATATSAYANITNGLTLNGTATLGNAAELRFQGTQTLGGNATVTLNGGADGLLTYQSGMTLTIGAGITVQGGGSSSSTTYIGSSSNNVSIVLLGTINANVAGQTIVVKPQGSGSLTNNGSINVTTGTLGLLPDTTGTLTNTGTISVSGGSITLGGAFTKAGLGTFNRTGGAVYLSGVLDNTSKTLAFDASSGSWNLYGGTVKGGTITQSGGAKLVLTSQGGTLDGVTFNGDLDATATSAYANITNGLTLNGTATLGNAAELRFQGTQTLGGNATVTLNGGADGLLTYQSGMTLTIGAGITVQGGGSSSSTTYIGSSSNNVSIVLLGTINANVAGQTIVVKPQGSGSLTNNGSINVTTGTLGLLPDTTGTLTNTGTISVSGGSITLGGAFTKAGLGTFNRTGGAVYLSGVLDNTSKTLAFDASSGSWNLYGGTVKGGTITQSGGAKLVLTSQGGTLDGVTFNGDLDATATSAYANITNGLTLNGTATLGNAAELRFQGTQTLGGNATVTLNGAEGLYAWSSGMTLTIGPGITVRGGGDSTAYIGYYAGNVSLVIHGQIYSERTGKRIVIQPTGTGTLVIDGGVHAQGGSIALASSVAIAASASFTASTNSSILIRGDLTTASTNPALFHLDGSLAFEGTGSGNSARQLEVLSADSGSGPAGFAGPFSLGALTLGSNTKVKLVDVANNSAGDGAEAIYVDSLIVPSGSELDLNGLKLYARAVQLNGSIVGGSYVQVPDSGPIAVSSPTPGAIGIAGELDEWTFFGIAGRAASIVVNPGSGGSPAPVSPYLYWANVRVLDPSGTVVASGASATFGQIVTLASIDLTATGIYKVQVNAPTGHASSVGNYIASVFDVTTDAADLTLNQTTIGSISPSFNTDEWSFSIAAGRQIRVDLLSSNVGELVFSLIGPDGNPLFTDVSGDSDLVTIPAGKGGRYVVRARASGDQTGTYSFAVRETTVTNVAPGGTFAGTFLGAGDAQLFRVTTSADKPLFVAVDSSGTSARVELYARRGAPPTKRDYDARYEGSVTGDPQLLIENAPAGDWYFLVYSASAASGTAFSFRAASSSVHLSSITPDRYGSGSTVEMSLRGAGFVSGTTVSLTGPGGATVSPQSISIDGFARATAVFNLAGASAGSYSVKVTSPGGESDTLPNSFEVIASGQAKLETHLTMPGNLGRHGLATIYVEYANTGSAAMPAPLIRLQSADPDGTDKPILTLDQSLISKGFWTSGMPDGFSTTIQILASGSTPGLLNPGERISVPVYYAGLLNPWDFSDHQVEMELRIFDSTNTDSIPWPDLKEGLRPTTIQADAWNTIYSNLSTNVGSTWGSFVQMLSDNAKYLGRLGQAVVDVGQLWSFEVQQAIGFNPVSTLASSIDASVVSAGGNLSFGRTFALSIDQRYQSSIFGRGWSAPWQTRRTVDADGSVNILGAGGSLRRFQPDSRSGGAYFGQTGETGTLVKIAENVFEVREQDGSITRFNAAGRIDYSQDANGNRITATYSGDKLTKLTSSSGAFLSLMYNSAGLVSSITDSAGRVTTFAYTSNQYLLSATGPDGIVTTYTYDTTAGSTKQHALLSVTTAGVSQNFTYDSKGRLASSSTNNGTIGRIDFAYDTAGTVSVTDAGGGTTSLYYDHRGLLGRVVDPFGFVTTTEYGADLRVRKIVDPLGQAQAFTWCGCGSLTSTTDQLGNTTHFGYDYVGPNSTIRRMTSFTDALGRTTRYTYDAKGNLLKTIYPDGSIEQTAAYDPMGDPLTFINRRGQTLSYTYNAFGQVSRQTFVDNTHIDMAYDARGNLITVTEPGSKITSYTYDAADRLTKVTYPQGRFLSFTYDSAGRRATMTDQTGYVLTYTYDAAGRLWKLTDSTSPSPIVTYTYDAAGRLSRKDNGNATYTVYTYDAAGQVLSIFNRAPGGSVNSSFVYTYDALGRRTTMTTIDGTWTYGYDATGQLTRAVFVPVSGSPVPAQDLTYIYDAVGNRIRTVENGVTTNYTTNNLNQYTKVGGDTLVYDADGNLISRAGPGGNATYTYDQQSRLTRVVTPEGTWEYRYDAFGSRISSTINGLNTGYLLDPTGLMNLVGEYDSGGALVARYQYGIGLISLDAVSTASRTFFEFDVAGSTSAITDVDGTKQSRYVYSPFGGNVYQVGSATNRFQFVGQFGVETESGLQFMGARYASPVLGRFVSADPIRLAGGDQNMYRIVGNSPANVIDPAGFAGVSVGGTFYVGMGGGGSVTVNGDGSVCLSGEGGFGVGSGWALGIGSSAETGVDIAGPEASVSFGAGTCTVTGTMEDSGVGADFGCSTPFGAKKKRGRPPKAKLKFGAEAKWALGGTVCSPSLFHLWDSHEAPVPPTAAGPIVASDTSSSVDPNALYAPTGYGSSNFLRSDALLAYRIEFENYGPGSIEHDGSPAPESRWATAPAQRVEVSNTLPSQLDLDTFAITGFGFGDFNIALSSGTQSWQQILTMTYNGQTFDVWFEGSLDRASRTLRVSFQSIMGESQLPPDVLTGFLPPEDGTGRGKGFITYMARPLAALPTGTNFRNIAVIRFDGQTAIATNQVDPLDPTQGTDPDLEALVTLDAGRPTSAVAPLSTTVATASFQVSWGGADDAGGSGIAGYNVYVSTDGGVYSLWQSMTTQTTAIFSGVQGKTYRFYSTAVDNVGLEEQAPSTADATTQVAGHVFAASPDQLMGSASSSAGDLNISMLSAMGQPILFRQPSNQSTWSGVDLQAKSGSPHVTGEVVTWVDPKDGLTYAAAMTVQGLALFTNTAGTTWTYRMLGTEVAGMPAIVGNLTAFTSIGGLVSIAGVAAGGDLIRYFQTGSGSAGGYAWSAINHGDDLRAQGLTMPQFVGRITSFVTSWDALNVVGLDASGQIQAVWWHQSLATGGKWTTNNLSAQTGAPALTGGLTVWLTSWNAINIAGTDVNGKLSATWWVPNFHDNLWNNSNLTDEIGGPLLEASSMTSWVTPWGAMNIAGREADGTVGVYWWVPNYNNNQWNIVHFRDAVPEATLTTGPVTGLTALGGGNSMSILSTARSGDVMRLWWSPTTNVWAEENLTQTAVAG